MMLLNGSPLCIIMYSTREEDKTLVPGRRGKNNFVLQIICCTIFLTGEESLSFFKDRCTFFEKQIEVFKKRGRHAAGGVC